MNEERIRILEMIEQGTITAEEGANLINALEELDLQADRDESAGSSNTFQSEQASPVPELPPIEPATPLEPPADLSKWRKFWYIPLAIGVVVTGISGLLVYAGNQGSWHWFWMMCVWTPLLFGIFMMVASWMSRTARWLHVRVDTGEDEWPRRIAISFPLPIGITAFGMKLFGRYIPGMENVPLDEAVMAIRNGTNPNSPLYVEVDSPGGEHVQVYIG